MGIWEAAFWVMLGCWMGLLGVCLYLMRVVMKAIESDRGYAKWLEEQSSAIKPQSYSDIARSAARPKSWRILRSEVGE